MDSCWDKKDTSNLEGVIRIVDVECDPHQGMLTVVFHLIKIACTRQAYEINYWELADSLSECIGADFYFCFWVQARPFPFLPLPSLPLSLFPPLSPPSLPVRSRAP